MDQVEETCALFQFALCTRAGTDCVGHVIRTVTERQLDLTVLSIDLIGAYDHIYRSSTMAKLHEVPGLRKLLPFVRRAHSRPSRCSWVDGQGERHWIQQHEGGEQGDPLVPRRYPMHFAKCLASCRRESSCSRIWTMCMSFPNQIARGFCKSISKTRVWNQAGEYPFGMVALGDDVWSPHGVKILGIPVGSNEFVEADRGTFGRRKVVVGSHLGFRTSNAHGRFCCSAQVRDAIIFSALCHQARWKGTFRGTMKAWWQRWRLCWFGVPEQKSEIATLQMRLGGLGLRSARRTSPAAYWASWADALHMISQRLPGVVYDVVAQLNEEPEGCLVEL